MHEDQQPLIRDTKSTELERIYEIEQGEARHFIIPYSLARHQTEFAKPEVLYKSIWCNGRHVGFLILVLESAARNVEFRRIVVIEPSRG